MQLVQYRGRRAVRIENEEVRVTVTVEGGHVAEILHKASGVNPLWTPHWPTIEPRSFDRSLHPEYGVDSEAQLLAGILGHNVCLDLFGAPSPEEAAAGIPVHGEAPVAVYEVSGSSEWMELSTVLPLAQLRHGRRLSLSPASKVIRIAEWVENLAAADRPVGWTQHVTLGPPFLQRGQTQFRANATRSKVVDATFNDGKGEQRPNAGFNWPDCPLKSGDTSDLRVFSAAAVSAGFTAHLMDVEVERAWFMAWSPATQVLLGYVWRRADFPWLARWEENHLRTQPPWNGNGLACGMEFGVSPFVESREAMVNRGTLFGVPTFRSISARSRVMVDYCAFVDVRNHVPEGVSWDGGDGLHYD